MNADGPPALLPGTNPADSTRGFTLVEIILVLALLALVATVTLTGSRAIAQATGEADAESAAISAISAARRAAVTTGQIVTLHAEDKALSWAGGTQDLPPGDTRVLLLPPQRDALMLIGGQASEEPIAQVRFYPDGTCDGFRVEFKRKQSSKIVSIDPWTCATLQSPGDQKP
jgi:prepilin-type N-terminal cleavage/methylation domain-containing protein